eukprot:TRINITY_DN9323_c0_g4_i1.p1 TRINITY_DN9323_c0_g4~~TRINITY_DN9323_c0_g4_i1.p1  ORF type:complete len:181 (-),score=34.83 TRINITY_DN9323_c0_g4_i1:152-694(-)
MESATCPTTCHFLLDMVNACPTRSFTFSDLWEIYLVLGTCIPHSLVAFFGLHWILFKCSYTPYAFFGSVSTELFTKVLKRLFKDPRPACYKGYGMPSSHAALAIFFLVWLCFAHVRNRKEWNAYVVLLAVNVPAMLYSRVYLGYHYMAQVATGALCGLAVGLIWLYLFNKRDKESKIKLL